MTGLSGCSQNTRSPKNKFCLKTSPSSYITDPLSDNDWTLPDISQNTSDLYRASHYAMTTMHHWDRTANLLFFSKRLACLQSAFKKMVYKVPSKIINVYVDSISASNKLAKYGYTLRTALRIP
jgi:hypothetical protein